MNRTIPDRFTEGTYGAPNADPTRHLISIPHDEDPTRRKSMEALMKYYRSGDKESGAWKKFAKSVFVMP